ncbi:hypothetical protein BDP27DRAFT_1448606 [Rhodocollybia butyracea]|uniref:Uncharacterized protein n=1 Tax=Rhodocollybia butyracea TaxID=206335 RepID=A0A9P5U6U2_9AGAR|nr:hypothetical protein BDP27DRAFT_1448606 [Rhodocollybia butyracea]
MPPSRLGTVFDYSGLRLHDDGSVVLQTPKNLTLRATRRTVRDAHGNWMAKDAGGLISVPKYRRVAVGNKAGDKEEEEAEYEEKSEEEGEEEEMEPAKTNKRTKFKTSRARKRVKFTTDEEYLAASKTTDNNTELHPESLLPLPSSDLLKCVHHYTSTYYDQRDLLLDASKQYRKERRERKLAKGALSRSKSQSQVASGSEEDELSGEDTAVAQAAAHQGKAVHARRTNRDLADMYKAMDGSALMAIGMLIQEHVAELLRP